MKKYLSWKTSLCAFAISVCGAIGLYCLLFYYACVAFHESSKSPIAFPLSFVLGTISFALFVILCTVYCRLRNKRRSVVGIILDVLMSILCLLPLFLLFERLAEQIYPLIRSALT